MSTINCAPEYTQAPNTFSGFPDQYQPKNVNSADPADLLFAPLA